MKPTLHAGTICAGLILLLNSPCLAHGGNYRGPGDVVRPGTKVPDPKGVAVVAPLLGGKGKVLHIPAIFRKHPPAERLKAKRAAELDAYRKLMERIYGLNITSTTTVKDFVTESDVVRTHLEGQLKGARITSVVYAEDGVVEVKMEVTLRQVITNVQKTYDADLALALQLPQKVLYSRGGFVG